VWVMVNPLMSIQLSPSIENPFSWPVIRTLAPRTAENTIGFAPAPEARTTTRSR